MLAFLRAPWSLVVGLTAVVICAGGGAELAAGPSCRVAPGFFVTCGGVALALLLALFIAIGQVMKSVIERQGLTPANRMTVRTLVRLDVAMFLISEAAALCATATGTGSAFLVVCCTLPLLMQISLLAQTVYNRTGVNQVTPG